MKNRMSKLLASLLVIGFLFTLAPLKSAEAVTYYTYRYTYTYKYYPSSNYSNYYTWYYRYLPTSPVSVPTQQQPVPQPAPAPAPTPQQPVAQQPTGQLSQYEAQVVELVNQERAKAGLKPLVANNEVSKVARLKSADMRDKGYFSHTSPTYGSPFDMMKSFGITYRTAGENIAAGQRTPAEVVTAWMNSPGHRANILNANFTEIGVGYVAGGSYGHYWTQMFIGR